ncbi:MAG: hypothetical protein R3F11_03350 [Verrucomicrobiales bacterium]
MGQIQSAPPRSKPSPRSPRRQAAASAKPILADGNAADPLRAAAAKALIASDAIPAAAESLGATAGQLRREIALGRYRFAYGLIALVAAVEAGRGPGGAAARTGGRWSPRQCGGSRARAGEKARQARRPPTSGWRS